MLCNFVKDLMHRAEIESSKLTKKLFYFWLFWPKFGTNAQIFNPRFVFSKFGMGMPEFCIKPRHRPQDLPIRVIGVNFF